mmetsp:Transcript_47515/g.57546  ORF Transcript_47515/g.57546 Transcript_47515/m.57546 type:complete len:225 (-) Transcript_47515:769-1443(-)
MLYLTTALVFTSLHKITIASSPNTIPSTNNHIPNPCESGDNTVLIDRGRNSDGNPNRGGAEFIHLGSDAAESEFITEYTSKNNVNGRLPISHVKSTFLSVVIFSCIYAIYDFSTLKRPPLRTSDIGIWLGVAVMLYLWEAATCSTRRYLSNAVTMTEMERAMERMRNAPPIVTWYLECFHYRFTDEFGYGGGIRDRRGMSGHRTSQRRSKVVTHRAFRRFELTK